MTKQERKVGWVYEGDLYNCVIMPNFHNKWNFFLPVHCKRKDVVGKAVKVEIIIRPVKKEVK